MLTGLYNLRISCFVGLCIELWKVTKVQDVSFDFENKILGFLPRVKLDDKKDYNDSGTKEYDRMAFKYLGMAFFPMAFCYCIYSVIYNEHKVRIRLLNIQIGLYQIISELVQFCSGFLLWIPPDIWVHHDDPAALHQLQAEVCGAPTVENDDVQGIKDVNDNHNQHLYCVKALNTFIDDIFAFVIKMPTMYRIGCFRCEFCSRLLVSDFQLYFQG